ncbi:M28 family peptidase [Bradyrhizobium elkanii]|uniref:Peptidase M28 domain-containing protein n=1 Tax=Bradyrhizobium elkanii TaxID=29448 RepID=A0ABV4EZZ1_BRAEL|nr:M28 family peptidase [Bradyrhizobium elkanii]MCP1757760.1 hypothetical protein [Bradyrhizobium elkanii]MCS3881943.1 hypothetical protein [Bradyrhizobium elkanii]MCS4218703.1 hypothetical protein [Bradyrhizobium elkanii]MCW2109989.1 hypothetical protein [Bradyrhizobium elkanii]MCW2201638.1 hypothetical protein [Bradyrhizobium elkanii]
MTDFEIISLMHTYCRPANSPAEARFIDRFLKPLGVTKDQFGNHFIKIGDDPIVLWSSHTDTVHTRDGIQEIDFDGTYLKLPAESKSSCLGADCTAGIWVMTEMIKAKVPGHYVFHCAEEIGCVGSRAIAEQNPKFLDGIKAAVAFDRFGVGSVITHQGTRTASDAFGESMMAQLPKRFKLDPTGLVTDTKQYREIVPECTNISVGYFDHHKPTERLDVAHLIELRNHMVQFDAGKLVIERDPTIVPLRSERMSAPAPRRRPAFSSLAAFRSLLATDIADLVWTYPRLVAQFLEEEMGVSFDELEHYIQHGEMPGLLFDDEDEDEDGGEEPVRRRA